MYTVYIFIISDKYVYNTYYERTKTTFKFMLYDVEY